MKSKHLHTDYYVHSNGTVTKGSKILKPWVSPVDNIARVSIIGTNGRRRNVAVNRLVANAFVPNPNGYPCAWNIDFDKSNNNASNLEWITKAESARRNKQRKNDWQYTPNFFENIATSIPWRATPQSIGADSA